MQIDYSITGIDQDGNAVVDVALSQDDALAFLMGLVTSGKAKITPTEAPAGAATAGATPPPAATMGKVLKVRKLKPEKPAKVAKGGRSVVDEKTIERIIALKASGHKPRDIAEKLGVAIANVYYYTAPAYAKKKPAVAKAAPAPVKTTETPTKVGERAIDQVDAAFTEVEFDKVREEVGDGIQLDLLRLALPDYSFAELRRARNFEDYGDYKLDYERSNK